MATEAGEVMGTLLDTTFEQAEAIIAQLKPQKQNVTCPPSALSEEVASLPINRIKHTPLQQETALHQDENITEMYKEEIFTRENGIQGQFLQKAVLRREDKGVEAFRTEKKTGQSTMQATSKYSVQEQDAAQSPSEQSLSEYVAEELQAKKERTTPLAKTTSKEWHGYEKKQEIQKEGQVKRAGSADEQLLSGATKSKERDQLELRRCFTREKESSASGNIQGNQLNLRSLENVGGERSQEGLGGRLEKQPIPCPQKDSAQVTSDVASTTFLGSSQHMETTQQLQRGQLEIRQGTWAVCSKATKAVSEKDEQEEQDEHPIAIRVVRSTEKQLLLGEDSPGSEYIEESLQLKRAGSDEEEPIVIKVVGATEQQPWEKPTSDVEGSWKQEGTQDEIQIRKQLISSRQIKSTQRELISAKVSEYTETTQTAQRTTDEGTDGKIRRKYISSTGPIISVSEKSEYLDGSLQSAEAEQAQKREHPGRSQEEHISEKVSPPCKMVGDQQQAEKSLEAAGGGGGVEEPTLLLEAVSEYMEESLQQEGDSLTMEGTRKQGLEDKSLEAAGGGGVEEPALPLEAVSEYMEESLQQEGDSLAMEGTRKQGLEDKSLEAAGGGGVEEPALPLEAVSEYMEESLQQEGDSLAMEGTRKQGLEDKSLEAAGGGGVEEPALPLEAVSEYMEESLQQEGDSLAMEGTRKQGLEDKSLEAAGGGGVEEPALPLEAVSEYMEESLQQEGDSLAMEGTRKQGLEDKSLEAAGGGGVEEPALPLEAVSEYMEESLQQEGGSLAMEGTRKQGLEDLGTRGLESAVSIEASSEESLQLEGGSVTVEGTQWKQGANCAEQEVISDRTPQSKLTEQDDLQFIQPSQTAAPETGEDEIRMKDSISVVTESTRSTYFGESLQLEGGSLTAAGTQWKQQGQEQEVISDRTPPSKPMDQDDLHLTQVATPAVEEGTWTKEAFSVRTESTRSVKAASQYFEESFRSKSNSMTAGTCKQDGQREQTIGRLVGQVQQVHGIHDGDKMDGKNLFSAQSSVSSKHVDNKSSITENETREVARRIQEEMHLLQRVSSTEINEADSAAAAAKNLKLAEGKASSEYWISAQKGAGTREVSVKSDIAAVEERESVHSSLKQVFGNRFDMDDYELVTYDFKIRISQEGAKVITACASSEETEKALDAFIEITPDAVRVNDTKVWGIGGA